MRPRSLATAATLTTLLLLAVPPGSAAELVRLDDPDRYDLQVQGFELTRDAEVTVEASGIGVQHSRGWWPFRDDDDDDVMVVYAWLLDAETREPVWVMDYDGSHKASRKRYVRQADERLDLEAGRYELYLFSGVDTMALPFDIRRDVDDDDGFWERLFHGNRRAREEFEEGLEDGFVSLSSDALEPRDVRRFEVTGELPGAILRHTGLGDAAFVTTTFELDEPMALRLRAHIEKIDDRRTAADYGWIVDAATREVVWTANEWRARPAGGGKKNRLLDETIELPAGRYELAYGTDDSHSFARFNTMPPFDPFAWGVTVSPAKGASPTAFRVIDSPAPAPVVALTEVGDHESREQAFRLDRPGAVHVVALGEFDTDDGQFYDHGWIVDAHSGETVWSMTRRNTTGAGGAEKNRRFDGLVELPAGEYIAYYVTDGSHSWEDWNSAQPFQPERWGLTVGPGPDGSTLQTFAIEELERELGILVSLVRIGDREREREQFQLDSETRVRVYAIGEGDDGEMYDYGYIVDDASGRRVWEMSWHDTRHAGGASKNRVADAELTLGPGTYEAVFVTDGSHSFEEWNAARPSDPLHWGITIRRAAD